MNSWRELTAMTGTAAFVIERVRLSDPGISIEGEFELPPLAGLSYEDQVFIAAFVKSHGSIKHMEKLFGVSYPTIKNRLNRIGTLLDFVDVSAEPDRAGVLDSLAGGEISVEDALEKLR